MKLIDAVIFASELDFADADVCEEFPDSYCEFGFSRENIRKLLRDAPTVEAVPVVRCEKCVHYEMGVCLKIYDDGAASRYAWQERKPDDFCSYGKLKEGADNEP